MSARPYKTGQAVSTTVGSAVTVGVVRWQMLGGIDAGTTDRAIWGTVSTMVNEGTNDYALNVPVYFDHLTGYGEEGPLVVVSPTVGPGRHCSPSPHTHLDPDKP